LIDKIYINTYRHEFSLHALINPLNAKLNPNCHLVVSLGAHHILHVSNIRFNDLSDHDAQIITLWKFSFLFPDMYFSSPEKSTTTQLVNSYLS